MKNLIIVLFALLPISLSAQQLDIIKKQVTGESYENTKTNWTTLCPSATYVLIKPTVSNFMKLLSMSVDEIKNILVSSYNYSMGTGKMSSFFNNGGLCAQKKGVEMTVFKVYDGTVMIMFDKDSEAMSLQLSYFDITMAAGGIEIDSDDPTKKRWFYIVSDANESLFTYIFEKGTSKDKIYLRAGFIE